MFSFLVHSPLTLCFNAYASPCSIYASCITYTPTCTQFELSKHTLAHENVQTLHMLIEGRVKCLFFSTFNNSDLTHVYLNSDSG